jgi:hypothetical protein
MFATVSTNTLSALQSSALEKQSRQISKCRLSLRRDGFHACVGNLFPNSQQLYEVALKLSRALTEWGRADFFKNLRASKGIMLKWFFYLYKHPWQRQNKWEEGS